MEDLVLALYDLENDASFPCDDPFRVLQSSDHPLIDRIVSGANKALITKQGDCNWDVIEVVTRLGFPVFPGEQDSFGWLVGCIQTSKGVITYG